MLWVIIEMLKQEYVCGYEDEECVWETTDRSWEFKWLMMEVL